MRTPLVAGNWKMNGSRASVSELASGIKAQAGGISGVEILVCPSYVFIQQVQELIENSSIKLGAQDLNVEAGGAYTGEIAGPMLTDFGFSIRAELRLPTVASQVGPADVFPATTKRQRRPAEWRGGCPSRDHTPTGAGWLTRAGDIRPPAPREGRATWRFQDGSVPVTA